MSALTAFGLAAVTAMVLFWWLEERQPGFVLGFGVACLAASLYGWLAGAWPFGLVELFWGMAAFHRWSRRRWVPGKSVTK